MALTAPIDETPIPGTPGSKIYWFEEFPGREATKEVWLAAIRRMPWRHLPFVCPVIVAPSLPGRVVSHGGTYGENWESVWGTPAHVSQTNVAPEFLAAIALGNSLHRLIGIPVPVARSAGDSRLTQMHEIGHSVSHSVPLAPPGATYMDFPGVHYPRRPHNVGELAAEAYARAVLNPGSGIVWWTLSRTAIAYVESHPEFGLVPGEATPAEIDRRFEMICRATLLRSPAMRMAGPEGFNARTPPDTLSEAAP